MPRGGFNNGPIRHARTCRIVWQAVSDAPGMPVRQLSAHTGLACSTITHALHTLRDVYGYIAFARNAEHARTILVKFVKEESDGQSPDPGRAGADTDHDQFCRPG